MNNDLSFVVTITVTCYSWAPSSGDHFLHVAQSPGRHSCEDSRDAHWEESRITLQQKLNIAFHKISFSEVLKTKPTTCHCAQL